MLAATGATPKHLRLVLLTNGAVVGAIGAVIGTVVGLALWFGVLPTLETGFDHRIDPLSLPWTLLVLVVLVAMLGATAAAWWPGRAVTRVPVTLALSARPPRPKPAHRSALLAALLIAGGRRSLAFSDRTSKPLIVAGLLATILGTLLLGPLAIRVFARAAGHVPIAPRLALRDLARYQARSGAALAAITLALGITAAVVVTAAAEEKQEDERMAAKPPNLSDRQIRVYTGRTRDPQLIPLPIQSPAQLAASAARVRQLAAGLGQAVVIPLWKPVDPGEPPLATFEGDRAIVAAGLARKTSPKGFNLASGLYVATPASAPAPRHRPRDGRSHRRLPGRPDRPHRGARHPALPGQEGARRHERPEDRQPRGPRGRGRELRPAVLVRHPRRSSPPRLAAGRERLARRVEQASDERTDRRRARPRGRAPA